MTQHTPGPWQAHPDYHAWRSGDANLWPQIWANEGGVALCVEHNVGKEIALANARLIAAAPDLLGELQRAEKIIADHVAGIERTAWPEVLHGIRAAIARAKGGAQ